MQFSVLLVIPEVVLEPAKYQSRSMGYCFSSLVIDRAGSVPILPKDNISSDNNLLRISNQKRSVLV